jgi:hypothetical protein
MTHDSSEIEVNMTLTLALNIHTFVGVYCVLFLGHIGSLILIAVILFPRRSGSPA